MKVSNELIAAAKLARRMKTDAYDSEVERLLNAAIQDLGCAGVVLPAEATALAVQACITYFLCFFGEPDNYSDLKKSYDEQKAQLRSHTGYTIWKKGGSLDPLPDDGSGDDGDDTEEGIVYFVHVTIESGVATVAETAAEIIAAYLANKLIVVQLIPGRYDIYPMHGYELLEGYFFSFTDGSTLTIRDGVVTYTPATPV